MDNKIANPTEVYIIEVMQASRGSARKIIKDHGALIWSGAFNQGSTTFVFEIEIDADKVEPLRKAIEEAMISPLYFELEDEAEDYLLPYVVENAATSYTVGQEITINRDGEDYYAIVIDILSDDTLLIELIDC